MSVMWCKGWVFATFVGNHYLLVSNTGVHCRKYSGLTKRVPSCVHVRYRIWVPNGFCMNLTAVHSEAEWISPFRYEHIWRHPLGSTRFAYSLCQHFVDLISSNSRAWDRLGMEVNKRVDYWTKLIQFNLLLPWSELNFHISYVEILTRLINILRIGDVIVWQ